MRIIIDDVNAALFEELLKRDKWEYSKETRKTPDCYYSEYTISSKNKNPASIFRFMYEMDMDFASNGVSRTGGLCERGQYDGEFHTFYELTDEGDLDDTGFKELCLVKERRKDKRHEYHQGIIQ